MIDAEPSSAERAAEDATMPSPHRSVDRRWSLVLWLVTLLAGAGLVGQLVLRWVTDGNGSVYVGRQLAGHLIVGRARPDWGPPAGALIFVVALAGGVIVCTAQIVTRVILTGRVLAGLAVLGTFAVLDAGGGLPRDRWGPGVWVCVVSSLVLVAGGLAHALLRWGGRMGAPLPRLVSVLSGVAGVLAIAATVAAIGTAGAGTERGAAAPEDALDAFVRALDNDDVFAALSSVSAGELEGLDSALDSLRDTVLAAPAMEGAAPSVDLEVGTGGYSTRRLAPGVVSLRTDIEVSIDAGGVESSVLGPLGGRRSYVVEDVEVVTVFEQGGWWVSPMLTAAQWLTDEYDLAPGDFTLVRAEPADADRLRRPVDDSDAMDALAEGVRRSDVATLTSAVDDGSARVLRVFERAVRRLLDDLSAASDLEVDFGSVAEAGTLESVEIVADPALLGAPLREPCAESGDASRCILAGLPLTSPVTLDDLPLVFDVRDDGTLLDVPRSLIGWADVLVPRIDPTLVALVLGSEDAMEPVVLAPGPSTAVSFLPGQYFRTYDVATTPGQPISVSLEGSGQLSARLVEVTSDGSTLLAEVDAPAAEAESSGFPPVYVPSTSSLQIQVRNREVCDDDHLWSCAPVAAEGSLRVSPVGTEMVLPDVRVSKEIEAGDTTFVQFVSAGDGRYRLTSSTDELGLFVVDEEFGFEQISGAGDETYNFPVGSTVTLALYNRSSAAGAFLLDIVAAPLPPRGFQSNGRFLDSVLVDISSGVGRATLAFRPDDRVSITAIPQDGQDIWLDGTCRYCSAEDVGYSGDPEYLSFDADGSTSAVISVGGYADYNDYGTVMLYVTFD